MKPSKPKAVHALKDVWGRIRIDTRWSLNDYMKRMRKSERIISVFIKQVGYHENVFDPGASQRNVK